MLIEFAHFLFFTAIGTALMEGLFAIWSLCDPDTRLDNILSILSYAILLFLFFSFMILLWGFYISDFSIAIVAENSSTLKPWYLRVGSIWATHQGSIFLWVLLYSFFSTIFIITTNLSCIVRSFVLSLNSIYLLLFLLYMAIFANPFARIYIPDIQGSDLNPLLSDISLIIHPPLLYTAYGALSLSFVLSIAVLISGSGMELYGSIIKYNLIGWIFLSLSLLTGSYWAYYELGWGGYWSFDPVENCALMPWLASLGCLHFLPFSFKKKYEKLCDLYKWRSLLFSILAFSLILLGAFYSRSTFLFSVHSFMLGTKQSIAILCLMLAFTIPAWVSLFINPLYRNSTKSFNSSLDIFYVFLLLSIVILLLGTFLPALYNLFTGASIYLNTRFYYYSFVPIAILLILLMVYKYIPNFQLLAVLILLYAGSLYLSHKILLYTFISCSLLLMIYYQYKARKINLYLLLAHGGILFVLLGVALSCKYSVSTQALLAVGDKVSLSCVGDSISVSYVKKLDLAKPDYYGKQYVFSVSSNRIENVLVTKAEQRNYIIQKMQNIIVGIARIGFSQIYIAPEMEQNNKLVVQVEYNYKILFIWLGCLLCSIGGAMRLFGLQKIHK